jgi:hypothetical protein
MDVYTQSNQKYFSLSGIIKLVYSCFPWKLKVREEELTLESKKWKPRWELYQTR